MPINKSAYRRYKIIDRMVRDSLKRYPTMEELIAECNERLGIDISLLSKIEHGERFVQAHMIKPLSEIFNLDYRTMQVQLLSQQLE